jgi:hypothetical protein
MTGSHEAATIVRTVNMKVAIAGVESIRYAARLEY